MWSVLQGSILTNCFDSTAANRTLWQACTQLWPLWKNSFYYRCLWFQMTFPLRQFFSSTNHWIQTVFKVSPGGINCRSVWQPYGPTSRPLRCWRWSTPNWPPARGDNERRVLKHKGDAFYDLTKRCEIHINIYWY